mgnify:FL=1
MTEQTKEALRQIAEITQRVENNLDNGASSQQLIKYFYNVKEIIISSKINLQIINESKM